MSGVLGPADRRRQIEEIAASHRILASGDSWFRERQSGGRLAARVIRGHLDQGWELLCNGIVVFDDAGALLPDGRTLAPAVVRLPARFAATA
jgi:Family of unknown function (DUF5999)